MTKISIEVEKKYNIHISIPSLGIEKDIELPREGVFIVSKELSTVSSKLNEAVGKMSFTKQPIISSRGSSTRFAKMILNYIEKTTKVFKQEDIQKTLGIKSNATAYRHLMILKDQGKVKSWKSGQIRLYQSLIAKKPSDEAPNGVEVHDGKNDIFVKPDKHRDRY